MLCVCSNKKSYYFSVYSGYNMLCGGEKCKCKCKETHLDVP